MNWVSQAIADPSANNTPFVISNKTEYSFEGLNRFCREIEKELGSSDVRPGENYILLCSDSTLSALAIPSLLAYGLNVLPLTSHDFKKSARALSQFSFHGTLSLAASSESKLQLSFPERNPSNPCEVYQGAVMVLTSGSTGSPKLVHLTPQMLLERAEIESKIFEIKSSQQVLSVMSFSHELGLTQIFSSLLMKSTLIAMSPTFPQELVHFLRQTQCSRIGRKGLDFTEYKSLA